MFIGLTAPAAFGAIPENGVISACYSAANGNMRVIDATVSSCRPSEVALQWSQQGSNAAPSTYLAYSPMIITNIGDYGSATAACNPGDKVLGGGHNTGASDISVGRSFPDTAGSWTVGLKPTAVAIGWQVVAVCLAVPAP
ncbi:MAG: hypothetical protein OEX21_00385 [Betaproteobacteria bacterium]|nr:hypothetical protein [Betaproteobacteria bacterium]